ncbi:Predicted site-specific integrase-resolvase [Kandleria vitulina]|uniref:Predicted site-specific integrase-resolvase n=1 Tax=Kandleria vitulina TaxID=1630 RepID=A0A1H2U9C7_9FIRM|nr:IS607 family transposase [Kandleria vitulina]SDW52189.1 Predicted site-specific integrase-resolvase [Kandleria vitulina]
MYKSSDFTKPLYKTKDIMDILNVSYSTIKNYDKSGKLKFTRTEKGRRVVFRDDLLDYLEETGMLYRDTDYEKRDVIYARVSSNEQKAKGDLDRQAVFLMENVDDLYKPIVLKEVGSGLNDKRTKIQELIKLVLDGKVLRVFVTYRDRLTRFGYHYLEAMFLYYGVPIIVVKDEEKQKSVEEELVEDMMSLVASFSGKSYGLRSRKRREKNKMMSQKNKELLSELMAASYAKDTLEKIEKLLSESDDSVIEKRKLTVILSQNSEDDFFE